MCSGKHYRWWFQLSVPSWWSGQARERDAVEYMEEILVTRTDIKIQSKQMQGLKNAVDELMLNNEYQLRLKDMNYKEKVRQTRPDRVAVDPFHVTTMAVNTAVVLTNTYECSFGQHLGEGALQ